MLFHAGAVLCKHLDSLEEEGPLQCSRKEKGGKENDFKSIIMHAMRQKKIT